MLNDPTDVVRTHLLFTNKSTRQALQTARRRSYKTATDGVRLVVQTALDQPSGSFLLVVFLCYLPYRTGDRFTPRWD